MLPALSTAMPRMKSEMDLTTSFYRLVECGKQLHDFPAFNAVAQRSRTIRQAIHNVLIVGLMSESVNIRGVDRVLFDDFPVFRQFFRKLPGLDGVHGKSTDFDGAVLAQDRYGSLEISWQSWPRQYRAPRS